MLPLRLPLPSSSRCRHTVIAVAIISINIYVTVITVSVTVAVISVDVTVDNMTVDATVATTATVTVVTVSSPSLLQPLPAVFPLPL